MVSQPFGSTKNHFIVDLQWMNCIVHDLWLYEAVLFCFVLKTTCFHPAADFVPQVDKVIQMFETMLTRHTTMVVGPTGGGKSVVINALCQAQTK